MFPHRKILKYTWISPDVQNHNQTNQILIDRKWHSIILDVRSFRVVDCDSDRYSITSTNAKSLSPSSGNSRFFCHYSFSNLFSLLWRQYSKLFKFRTSLRPDTFTEFLISSKVCFLKTAGLRVTSQNLTQFYLVWCWPETPQMFFR